jgi:thioredoxin:protein disulfide reductase
MKYPRRILPSLLLVMALPALAQSPFDVQAKLTAVAGKEQLHVQIKIPDKHYLYSERLSVNATEPAGVTLTAIATPKPKMKYDEGEQKEVGVFGHDFTLIYAVAKRGEAPLSVQVSYQGCSDAICFMPEDIDFVLASVEEAAVVAPVAQPPGEADGARYHQLDDLLSHFEVRGRLVGYTPPAKFLDFLNRAEASQDDKEPEGIVQRVFQRYGLLAVLLILIPFGFMLNLTPCVLPMIPINLAIIGAGAQAGSKKRGFALGSVYGAGMAVVYGLLGLVVIFTGQQFGALNASPWFNLAIAALFIGLALAMFDVFVIDFSRFQRRSAAADGPPRAPYATAFLLGGTAALLAGACVAPVLISVLLLASNLYRSNPAALLLPFMLGVGMAAPWPFAGAGMSFLPKPGAWMDWVKRAFGVLILLMALYYGGLAIKQFSPAGGHRRTDVAADLKRALAEDKPVFLDFWALSCSNCKKMEKDVFPEESVAKRLEDFVFAGVQGDLLDRADVNWAGKRFKIVGNPTYIILVPKLAPVE